VTTTTVPEPTVAVTEYTVSCLPEDHRERHSFTINVEWRGPGDVWAVTHLSMCLDSDGEWDYEMSSSNRTAEWKATHRFPLDQALALAKAKAPAMTVNGWTVEAVLREWER
jgi:hypothetical protein